MGDVMLRRLAEPARSGVPDRPVGFACIIDGKPLQNARHAALQISAATIESRYRQRRSQEDDTEIGVLPDGDPRRLHGTPNAGANGQPSFPDDRCDRRGALLEVGNAHAVAVAEAVHIAGLQRIELGKAGIMEASRNELGL
jgi:hypothetical protein